MAVFLSLLNLVVSKPNEPLLRMLSHTRACECLVINDCALAVATKMP